MKVTGLIKAVILLLAILAVTASVFTMLSDDADLDKIEATETRHTLITALHQFQAASEALSRLSRSWVIVTTTQYDDYWTELNVTDNIGSAVRSFHEYAPPEIIALLDELITHSNELRRIEALAFEAKRGNDSELAFNYVYSLEYTAAGAELTLSLNNLRDALLEYTQQTMDNAVTTERSFSRLSDATWIAFALISVGSAFFILRAVKSAMTREQEASALNEIFIKHSPLVMNIWDEATNMISTSQQAVELFELEDMQQYLDRFFDLSPEYQPCGTSSRDKSLMYNTQAFNEGYVRFEWMHQKLNGEPVPSEIILARFMRSGKPYLAAFTIDLRQAKEAAQREREVLERWNYINNASPIAVNFWNENFEFIDGNDMGYKLFGFANKEDWKENWQKTAPEFQPDGSPSLKKISEIFEKTLADGYYRFEWLHYTADGEPLPLDVIQTRVEYYNTVMIVAYLQDLRPLKEASAKIQEAEAREREVAELQQRMSAMINASPLACFVLSEKFEVLDLNREAINLFEAKDKQDFIENFIRTAPEYQQDGEPSIKKMGELMVSSMEYICTEWTAQTFRGEQFPCELHATRFFNDGAKMVIVHMRDLRDFYTFKEMSERVQIMFDTTPLIIEYWDENFMPVDCNKANLDFFGLTKEQYKQYIEEIRFNPPIPGNTGDSHRSGWDANIKRIFEAGFGRFDWTEPLPDGTNVPLEVEGYRMMLNNKPVVVTYSRDVTELRKLQNEEQRAKIAEESNRAKTMFLANMSHEIRTPMNSILGYSELALDETIPDTTREHLEKIFTNTKWLLTVINDVLDITKIESGNMEIEQIPFDISQVTEHCQSLLSASAKAKGLALSFSTESSQIAGKRLLGDPTKLSQICINLLSNAIKFTDTGMVSLCVTMSESSVKSCTLDFIVSDTGIGMTAEQSARILEPFEQADSSITRKHGGTGLGLPIAKSLIEAMGGKLAVESVPGFGSKFSFTLAFTLVKAVVSANGSSFQNAENIEKPHFTQGDILVVDDNSMNLGVVCEHLRRVGLNSYIAKDGKEAVEAVKERMVEGAAMYDLIFMDIHMPEMDGKEAATIINGFNLSVPIVAMTAETMVITEEAPYRDFGMEGYLGKPFTTQELWKCLLRYLTPSDVQVKNTVMEQPDSLSDEDAALFHNLKIQFFEGNQNTVEDIANALEQGDIKLAHRLSHTLKSSAGLIGKTRLQQVAADAEIRLKCDNALPNNLLEKLREETAAVLDELGAVWQRSE